DEGVVLRRRGVQVAAVEALGIPPGLPLALDRLRSIPIRHSASDKKTSGRRSSLATCRSPTLVEQRGIEPLTSSMPRKRAPAAPLPHGYTAGGPTAPSNRKYSKYRAIRQLAASARGRAAGASAGGRRGARSGCPPGSQAGPGPARRCAPRDRSA